MGDPTVSHLFVGGPRHGEIVRQVPQTYVVSHEPEEIEARFDQVNPMGPVHKLVTHTYVAQLLVDLDGGLIHLLVDDGRTCGCEIPTLRSLLPQTGG